MDAISPKLILTVVFFVFYAILFIRPLMKFVDLAASMDTEEQASINPLGFVRWMMVRFVLLFPLVGIQAL